MHGCDEVTLVWGSLRLAPTNIRWNRKQPIRCDNNYVSISMSMLSSFGIKELHIDVQTIKSLRTVRKTESTTLQVSQYCMLEAVNLVNLR